MSSLENVKAGDNLILHGRQKSDRRVVVVERTTKTQIIAAGRFRKKDGYVVGGYSGGWTRPYVALPREGEIDEVKEAQMHQYLVQQILDTCQYHVLKEMSPRQIQRLYAVLQEIKSEECQGCGKVDPDEVCSCPHCEM